MTILFNILLWLIPGGILIQALRGLWAYRQCRKAAGNLPYEFNWTVLKGAKWRVLHPATGRFCHICGADGEKNEPCDAGLHS